MSDDEWTAIEMVLEECWPGNWSMNTGRAYRMMLDAFAPVQILAALRMVGRKPFRPSAGEILAQLEADPGRPGWTEVLTAIYGRQGVLSARPPRQPYETEHHRQEARYAACLERARGEFHPLIAAFVETATPRRLDELGVGDEEYGGARREQLRKEWEAFVEHAEERRRFGLPLATGGRRMELRPLDVLAGLRPGSAPQLEA